MSAPISDDNKLTFFYGNEQVTEHCMKVAEHPRFKYGVTFTLATRRAYVRGAQCWLENDRKERIGARIASVKESRDGYLVDLETIIRPGW